MKIITASTHLPDRVDLGEVAKVVLGQSKWPDEGRLSPEWSVTPVKDHFRLMHGDLPIMDYSLAPQGNIREIKTYGMNVIKLVNDGTRLPCTSEMFSMATRVSDGKSVEAGSKERIKGGKADEKSAEDIARMHGVSVELIREQIGIGKKIEKEHVGDDTEMAEEIARDHLVENPWYYTLLKYMEKVGEEALDDKLPEGLCPFAYHMAKAYVEATKDDWNYITPEDLKKKLDGKGGDRLYLLDIRKPEVYAEGHIPGANNIFWLDLFKVENLKKLPKDRKIVVYCYVGHTSSQALVFLKLLGFDAVGMKFGIGQSPVEGIPVAGWKDFGFEMKEGKKP